MSRIDGKVPAFRGNAALITLGCPKNQVDSEVMAGILRRSGYRMVTDLETADVAVVNTCGFLQSSVQESLDSILDVAEYRNHGRLRRIVVAGCLVERFKRDIEGALPEVDVFLDTNQILSVGSAADGLLATALDEASRPYFLYDESVPRIFDGHRGSAYVKVAEGCDRECSFCIIPRLRGPMRSRSIESIKREVLQLSEAGVKEINLVAQDLTDFGRDHGSGSLEDLLREIDALHAVAWVRLLYAYPPGVTAGLLRAVTDYPSVCDYLDLPLQHSSERILRSMRRPLGRYSSRRIVDFIRKTAPSISLRTAFIVGYPGETDEDFRDLENFVLEGHFSSVGVFTYSREEETHAFDLGDPVSGEEKEFRLGRIMEAQQKVLASHLSSYEGEVLEVLIEGVHEETDLLLSARSRFQAPEVDGRILINDFAPGVSAPSPGDMGLALITEVSGYDLVATFLGDRAQSGNP